MKKTLTLIIATGIGFQAIAQFEGAKQVFSSPKLKETVQAHKTVAILPFGATISYKRMPKNFNAEQNKSDEQKLAVNMQQGMYTYLLRKASDFTVTFQDIERTNAPA